MADGVLKKGVDSGALTRRSDTGAEGPVRLFSRKTIIQSTLKREKHENDFPWRAHWHEKRSIGLPWPRPDAKKAGIRGSVSDAG